MPTVDPEEPPREAAGEHSLIMVEFSCDGAVLAANAAFLSLMNYAFEEIRGRPHSLFVAPEERASAAYAALWEDLRRGAFVAREVRRITKDGRAVWLQTSYLPVLDRHGRPLKIVEFAADITAQVATGAKGPAGMRSVPSPAAGS